MQLLSEQIDRLLANMRRLVDENARLKAALSNSQASNADLRERMADARSRVEFALSRLPADIPDAS
ncbi:MAG: TIGR02449 family protein [Betaproteobacteria bacterium]|nr:TIGR02449 family protein [Betaproteobacteria bacterium]